jgi:hypothetical protein
MAIIYNTSIVRSGLVLHLDAANPKSYPGSGTAWRDLSGNALSASISNNTYNAKESFTLTSSSNNTITGTSLSLTGGSFTMEAWVYPIADSLTGTNGQIFTQDSGTGDGNGWQWRIQNSNNTIQFIYWTSSVRGTATSIYSSTPLIYSNWYQLIVTYNGTTIKLYQNTVETHSSNPVSALYGSTATIGIGMFNRALSFSEILAGKISTIRCYNRALTALEISQNFEATRGRYNV